MNHEHDWKWVETELGGEWAKPGTKHYECSCGATKQEFPGEMTVITMAPTVKQMGDPRGKQATWTMLPPAFGESLQDVDGEREPVIVNICSQCAVEHHPNEPHNPQSLAYQYAFYAEHDRWPTWADAMAHCPTEIQQAWRDELKKRGVPDEEL